MKESPSFEFQENINRFQAHILSLFFFIHFQNYNLLFTFFELMESQFNRLEIIEIFEPLARY